MNKKLKTYIICLVVMLTIFFAMACDISAEEKRYTKKQVVDAVYWHEGTSFTVVIEKDNKLTFVELPSYHIGVKTEVFTDAVKKCWVEYDYVYSSWTGAQGWCKIHLTDLSDLQTAGWDHGKFGVGNTHRIR